MDKTIENHELLDETIRQRQIWSPRVVKPQPLSLSMQLQETREERSIENYSRHAKAWDKHEKQVKLYFEQQDIKKYGSKKEAKKVAERKAGISSQNLKKPEVKKPDEEEAEENEDEKF